MGGEATPGLGAPEDEELLGRVSRDFALCMPEPCAALLLPASSYSLFAMTCCILAALIHQGDADTDVQTSKIKGGTGMQIQHKHMQLQRTHRRRHTDTAPSVCICKKRALAMQIDNVLPLAGNVHLYVQAKRQVHGNYSPMVGLMYYAQTRSTQSLTLWWRRWLPKVGCLVWLRSRRPDSLKMQ